MSMAEPQHILVVSPAPSTPASSGNRQRVSALFQYLKSQGFVVHFVLYNVYNSLHDLCDAESYGRMAAEWDYFDFVPKSPESKSATSRLRERVLRSSVYRRLALRGLRPPLHNAIDDWCCDALVNFVRWKLSNYPIHAVFVEYVFLSRVFEVAPADALKILDTHDLFAGRHQRMVRGGLAPSFFSTTRRQEDWAFRRADVILAIQEREREEIASRVDRQVLEVTHFESRKPLERPYGELKTIGVLGSRNGINQQSISLCIEEMARRNVLDRVKFKVGGDICADLQPGHENVELLGRVPSLDEFYRSVDLVVNPAVAGTGLKIKSVEAISYGAPLVCTACGAEGMRPSEDYHQFETVGDMVEHLRVMLDTESSLKPYHQASIACFQKYQSRLQTQLERLTAVVAGGKGGLSTSGA